MLVFPLSLSDLSLLFAAVAVILLATSELLFSYTGSLSVLVDKRRLRFAGIVFSLLFVVLVGVILMNHLPGR